MTSKRKLSKSGASAENLIEELPKIKKSRVSGKKKTIPQDGVVENNSVFGQLLKTAGITLKAGENQNEIAVDGAIFQKKLNQALRKHPSYPQIVEEFISGLESHAENRDQFRNCLLPCVPAQNQETSVGNDGLNLPRLIINQLKWLDRIVDSKDLVLTIMQLICVSPLPIQHDIITSLPEILEDSQHSEIARELSSLLKEKTELTVPILDALSSLNLDLGLLSEVRQSVMITVAAVKVEDLPVVVKFILRSIKPTDAVEAIENVASASDHKVLDLIVLLIIYATNVKSKKQIERVLRSKIRSGYMQEQLLRNAFQHHLLVMRDLFPAILSLSEIFVHSADACIVSYGSCMYKQAFTVFDSYCQQEIVGALVTHACGGNAVEVDVSLDVLIDLVSLHTSSIVPYAVFLKSILDYMDNLSPQQIRKLFHILSTLAFSPGHKSGYIQITSLLELVCSCCEQVPQALALYYDELANLIQKGNLDLQILVGYRANWIGSSVVKDFAKDFVADLLPTEDGAFLFPVKPLYSLEDDDNEENEDAIVINLLPLLSQSYLSKHEDEKAATSKDKRSVSPVCLPPFFRLLRLCVSELNNGNLEEIDALLGCPLYLTDLEVGEKLDSLSKQEREFLCLLLFHALNWFYEVVNAFCKEKDPEMKGKVLVRLQNITELQCLLEKCLAANPGFVPPPANFDSETSEGVSVISTLGPTKKKSKGQKKQKPDGSKNTSADNSQLDENTEPNQPETEISQQEKTSEVVQIGPAELLFLLEDMCRKLEHVLIPAAAKRAPFLKALIAENHGVVDGPGVNIQEHQQMSSCYQQLLQVFRLLFAWSGFSQPENHSMLKSGLHVLAHRLKPGEKELPLEELLSQSFQYLLNLQHSVPNIFCALSLTQLLLVIAERSVVNLKNDKIASITKRFLCQSWVQPNGARQKGTQFNDTLHTLFWEEKQYEKCEKSVTIHLYITGKGKMN
ncbi:hypothetical protein lerEdw1_016085 [Lerista edwardsae]|nr:hypothetical protein lerEdw1_016085 [Lerista edwardsae]